MNTLAYLVTASGLLGLLIHLLILLLILGLIWWVVTLIPLPPPFGQVLRVVFAIICVIVLIYFLLGLTGCSTPPTDAQLQSYATTAHTAIGNGLSDYKTVKQIQRTR